MGQASSSHTKHGTSKEHHPEEHSTCCPLTHLQVHLILDGLPIRPLQPAPCLPCGQKALWARGKAQPRGLHLAVLLQGTVISSWRQP